MFVPPSILAHATLALMSALGGELADTTTRPNFYILDSYVQVSAYTERVTWEPWAFDCQTGYVVELPHTIWTLDYDGGNHSCSEQ